MAHAIGRLRTAHRTLAIATASASRKVQRVQERGRVPEAIWSKVGTNLHLRSGHPLCTLREGIEAYFDRLAPGEFAFHSDLSPVVTTRACFDELLVPVDHISRAKSDTYYVDDEHVLRAHMTAHDAEMLRGGLRAFVNCGDVYRRDTVDRTHYPVFHQMDGVRLFPSGTSDAVIEHDLKKTLEGVAGELFEGADMRWVDAYFPFTSPSWELEVRWGGEWLELLGCGMLERGVLRKCSVDDDTKAWAFGLGLERLAMVLFGVPDIRLFWSDDPRFISQFEGKGLKTRFKPFSVHPPVRKDMSFWVNDPSAFHVNDVHEIARTVAGNLVETVEVVDRFERQGRESFCFRVTFRSMERSLTHDEVNVLFDNMRSLLSQTLPIELR